MKKKIALGALGLCALMLMAPTTLAQDKPAEGEKKEGPKGSIPATPMIKPGEAPADKAAENAIEIKGKVVGADGKAVAGVTVCSGYSLEDGVIKARGKTATTDAEGNYALASDKRMLPRGVQIQAFNDDGSMIGMGMIEKCTTVEEMKVPVVTMNKTTKVTLKLAADGIEAGVTKTYASATLTVDGKDLPFQTGMGSADSITLLLSKGTYELRLGSRDPAAKKLKSEYVNIKVEGDKPTMDLGTIKLVEGPLYSGVGKPAPTIDVTAIKGTTFKNLEGFKGKWVLIDFWGVW